MVLFDTLLHPIAAALLGVFVLFQEFYVSANLSAKSWFQTIFHLVIFLLCLLAFLPTLSFSPLIESALLGAIMGLTLVVMAKGWFCSENKIIATKKRAIGQKVPLLFGLALLTMTNHFGQVYGYYLFWIISISSLLLVYQFNKGTILISQYAIFVFSLSAAFLVTLNAELSYYWMRIPQSLFLVLAFIFLQRGVVDASKKSE